MSARETVNTAARRGLLVCAMLALTACVHSPQPAYHWGSYQEQVYSHLKGDDPLKQIEALERDLQVALAADRPVPPGMHMHLAMLYAETGNGTKARESLLTEKTRFPESATYVDFLIRNLDQQ